MLKQTRQTIIQALWDRYLLTSAQAKKIQASLQKNGTQKIALDHFAVIDLPGPQTGIPRLTELFSHLGFSVRGKGYLADKQNDFVWLAEIDCTEHAAHAVLPQVVVADFRLDELPQNVKKIIEKYSAYAPTPPTQEIKQFIQQLALGKTQVISTLKDKILHYLAGRDWPLPTKHEFLTVKECNELLAWVLIFGRKPNHFTFSVHLMDGFANLHAFNQFIEKECELPLNQDGGIIKGNEIAGVAQSSTIGPSQTITLQDGCIDIPAGFVEFVWRYSTLPKGEQPIQWEDYYTGFVAHQANHVIESLYT